MGNHGEQQAVAHFLVRNAKSVFLEYRVEFLYSEIAALVEQWQGVCHFSEGGDYDTFIIFMILLMILSVK